MGRPRGRRSGGGSAGRLDSIQDRTSAKLQQSRRLLGSFRGRGIKWWYFWFDEQVRIVVTDLPIIGASSSIKMSDTKTDWGRSSAGASLRTSTRGGDSPTRGATDFFLSSKGVLSNHQNGGDGQLGLIKPCQPDMNIDAVGVDQAGVGSRSLLRTLLRGNELPTSWSLGDASIFPIKPFLQHHRSCFFRPEPYLLKLLVTCFSTTSVRTKHSLVTPQQATAISRHGFTTTNTCTQSSPIPRTSRNYYQRTTPS